jgi:phage tail-like protein
MKVLEKVKAAVNEAAAAARDEAKKGVLKADYKAIDGKYDAESGEDGQKAAASDDSKGSTTAGAGSELEEKEYEAKDIEAQETNDNTGKSVENPTSENLTTPGEAGKLELPEYEAKELETKDDDPLGEAAKNPVSEGLTTAGEAGEIINEGVEEVVDDVKKTIQQLKNLLLGGGDGGPDGTSPKGGARKFDHHGGFRFEVQLGNVAAGAFRAVDGLSGTVELIEYQGGGDLYPRQIPGRPKVVPVVLKKGYVNTAVVWDWMKTTMDGGFQEENVSIILKDDSGQEELARYNLSNCWPSRWAGWQLDANGSNAMVEEMELQVRTLERVGK